MQTQTLLDSNNRLFTLARQGKRQPSGLEAIVLVVVALALVIIPGQILARSLVPSVFPAGIHANISMTVGNIVGFLPALLGMWVWLRVTIKRPFRSLGFESAGALQRILRGALAAALMIAALVAIIPGKSFGPAGFPGTGPVAIGIVLLSLGSYAVQSSAEEVLFRGWLLPVIGSRYRPWIGVFVSTLLFSLAHGANPDITPLAFLNLFLFGAFAAAFSLADGSLWGACAWHAVWNWAEFTLLGFPLDGSAQEGVLTSVRVRGPNLITGGAFGPDGGLAATAVLLIGIGLVVVRTRRIPQQPQPCP
jgi:membrane protease YdiL (CAAX protease family)